MIGRKKIFSLVVGATLVVTGFLFSTDTAFAIHNPPPQEASCEPFLYGGNMGTDEYECTGNPVGVLGSIEGKVGNLIAECKKSGGSSLSYRTEGPYYWYCYEASEEKIFDIDGVSVSTTSGILDSKIKQREEARAVESIAKGPSCPSYDIGCNLVNVFFGVPASIFKALFSALAALVSWAITTLIDIPVLPGGNETPRFVTEGWNLTRNLVNLLFLIVLVFIGFATILRLQSYEMKKTVPMLLIVALLINFSGTLVGLIVDIANIITNFFVLGISHVSWDLMSTWKGAGAGGGTATSALISYHISRIAFYSIASFVYLPVIFIFFLRVFILWTLVILAPFAFAAYILPSTRSMSSKWFSALIQWAFVGVPLSFFILLSALTLEVGSSPEALMKNGAGVFANFLAPFTSLVILMIGVGISISMAPAAAGKAIGFGKAYGNKIRKTAAKWVGQKAETAVKLPEGAKAAAGWLMRNPVTSRIGGVGVGRLLTRYAKGAQKRREDAVQGLPLGQQAAGMGRSIPDHVRQMSPDNFVDNVGAGEITPEVFLAMTMGQLKAVGTKGTDTQINALLKAVNTTEAQDALNDALAAPPPITPQQQLTISKFDELINNANFPYP